LSVRAYDAQMSRLVHVIDERTDAEVLDQLALLARADERIIALGMPPGAVGLSCRIETMHRPFGSAWLAGRRIRRRGPGAEIVHAWSVPAARAALAMASGRSGRVLFSLSHLPGKEELPELVKRARRDDIHLTVPTQTACDALGGRSAGISILPPVAGPRDDSQARRRRTRRALGISDEEVLLVAPAWMRRDAGHFQAIWTHAIIRQVLPNVRLLLPGTGPFERSVRFFSRTTRLESEILLTGASLPRADALAGADIALFLARRAGPLTSLAEAMALGLPIVASNRREIAECAPHNHAALLVKADSPRAHGEAVLRIIEDRSLADRLGRTAASIAAHRFDRLGCRERLERIYSSLARWAAA